MRPKHTYADGINFDLATATRQSLDGAGPVMVAGAAIHGANLNRSAQAERINNLPAQSAGNGERQMDYSDFIGRYCVVRARDASPHAGIVEAIDGRTVKMREARRLWRWRVLDKRGISLSEVAEYGIDAKDWSRVGVPTTVLIQDACEVIVCSASAEKTLRDIAVYVP